MPYGLLCVISGLLAGGALVSAQNCIASLTCLCMAMMFSVLVLLLLLFSPYQSTDDAKSFLFQLCWPGQHITMLLLWSCFFGWCLVFWFVWFLVCLLLFWLFLFAFPGIVMTPQDWVLGPPLHSFFGSSSHQDG